MSQNQISFSETNRIKIQGPLPEKLVFQEGVRRAPDRGFRLSKAQTKTALKNALRYTRIQKALERYFQKIGVQNLRKLENRFP